jgi:AbrB family looped-hinge helix DNA binding protein
MLDDLAQKIPKFYGSATVGERGQVAIPAEARRDQSITPASKLLVFGSPDGKALILIRAEAVTEFITNVSALLSQFAQTLQAGAPEPPGENE